MAGKDTTTREHHASERAYATSPAPKEFSNTTGTSGPLAFALEAKHYYIVGGIIIVCVLLSLVLAFILWRKRRASTADLEASLENGDRIYVEIAEEEARNQGSTKKQTQQQNKKGKEAHQNNNNDDHHHGGNPAGIEVASAIDTAPDIITAHDNESIYETLDGRRAARARADHADPTRSSDPVCASCRSSAEGTSSALNTTYDHLSRFTSARSSHPPLPPALDHRRLTDPEVVVTRPKPPRYPQAVRSAEGVRTEADPISPTRRRSSWQAGLSAQLRRESSSDSARSSLTELARQSACGGKRLVCQLTMVGVVEDGKGVKPVQTRATNNAYFILEPNKDTATEVREDGSPRSFSPRPTFRIRGETGGDLGPDAVGTAPSDYFILEPLGQEQGLADLAETLASPPCPGHVGPGARGAGPYAGEGSAGSIQGLTEGEGLRPSTTMRFHSCPADCPAAKSAGQSPPLPPRKLSYERSFSSPQSSLHEKPHNEEPSAERKMDADVLKARIRQEMLALGFASDDDANENDACDEADPKGEVVPSSAPRPPGNEYFILEPEAGAADEGESEEVGRTPTKFYFTGERVAQADTQDRSSKPSQPTPDLPPRLPQRNKGHVRSKSETPRVKESCRAPKGKKERGPVIVTLKKSGRRDREDADSCEDVSAHFDHREPFRPRFQSESRGNKQ